MSSRFPYIHILVKYVSVSHAKVIIHYISDNMIDECICTGLISTVLHFKFLNNDNNYYANYVYLVV